MIETKVHIHLEPEYFNNIKLGVQTQVNSALLLLVLLWLLPPSPRAAQRWLSPCAHLYAWSTSTTYARRTTYGDTFFLSLSLAPAQ